MICTSDSLSRALLRHAAIAVDRREVGDLVLHAGERHQAGLGRHDVARPQRRIGLHVHARQPERVAAIAGAAGDQLLAVDEGVVEIGIAAAVARRPRGRCRCRNTAASGSPGRTHGSFGRAHAGMRLHREIAAVAGAHADSRSPGRLRRALRRRVDGVCDAGERIGEGADIGRQSGGRLDRVAQAAENALENTLRRGRRERSERQQAERRKRRPTTRNTVALDLSCHAAAITSPCR